ncbi:hypothetical protein [Stappia sp.]|uniref:hypothetical protein n=1 Tax=Stappia sp. TaxID=1870903 RepID=UPI003C7C0C55
MDATLSPLLALTCVAPAVVQPRTVFGETPLPELARIRLASSLEERTGAGTDVRATWRCGEAGGVGTDAYFGVDRPCAEIDPVAIEPFGCVGGGKALRSTRAGPLDGPAMISSKLGCDPEPPPSMAR